MSQFAVGATSAVFTICGGRHPLSKAAQGQPAQPGGPLLIPGHSSTLSAFQPYCSSGVVFPPGAPGLSSSKDHALTSHLGSGRISSGEVPSASG